MFDPITENVNRLCVTKMCNLILIKFTPAENFILFLKL